MTTNTNTPNATGKETPAESKPLKTEGKKLAVLVDNKQPESTPPQEQKPEQQTPVVSLHKKLTIAEKLAKLDEFNELVERRDLLIDSREKLKLFYISDSGSAQLKLTDSKNNSFTISHPVIIAEMVKMSTVKLTAEIEEIESKLEFSF